MQVRLDGKYYQQDYVKCPDCKQVMVLKLSTKEIKMWETPAVYYSCGQPCGNFHSAFPNGQAVGEAAPRSSERPVELVGLNL